VAALTDAAAFVSTYHSTPLANSTWGGRQATGVLAVAASTTTTGAVTAAATSSGRTAAATARAGRGPVTSAAP